MRWKWVAGLLAVLALGVAVISFMTRSGGDSEKPSTSLPRPVTAKQRPRPRRPAASNPASPQTVAGGESTASSAQLPPATSSAGEPLAGVTIAVDPGHNGGNATHPEEIARPVPAGANGTTKACNTTGTETNDGLLTEAQFNWDVAMDLVPRLRLLGANVVLTRHSNGGVGPCVNERAEIANRAGAAVDVAIHADGNEAEGAHGFDVIHATTAEMVAPTMAGPSLRLAKDIRDSLERAGVPPANYVGTSGLDARSDLAGLNLAQVPAVLVELGNMRSASEAARLEDPAYRRQLATALAGGIVAFLRR